MLYPINTCAWLLQKKEKHLSKSLSVEMIQNTQRPRLEMNPLLLVPLTLIMAYYNWLSSFHWQSDSKAIVPQSSATQFICQTLLLP